MVSVSAHLRDVVHGFLRVLHQPIVNQLAQTFIFRRLCVVRTERLDVDLLVVAVVVAVVGDDDVPRLLDDLGLLGVLVDEHDSKETIQVRGGKDGGFHVSGGGNTLLVVVAVVVAVVVFIIIVVLVLKHLILHLLLLLGELLARGDVGVDDRVEDAVSEVEAEQKLLPLRKLKERERERERERKGWG